MTQTILHFKNIIITFSFLFALFNKAFSQELKTYKGNYSSDGGTGTIEYSYYEGPQFIRIYHGKFKFEESHQGYRKVITGEYINGIRIGEWEEIITRYKETDFCITGGTSKNIQTGGSGNAKELNYITDYFKNNKKITTEIYSAGKLHG